MTDTGQIEQKQDKQLIEETLAGDTQSFGILVKRHWNLAFALALSKINDAAAAEDIAQESFLKAYTNLKSLRDGSKFCGWLSRIVCQQTIDALRKAKRDNLKISADCNEAKEISIENRNTGLTIFQINHIRAAVRRLPEKMQEIILMRFVGGLKSVQIAQSLDMKDTNVRTQLHRAYEILRKELENIPVEVE